AIGICNADHEGLTHSRMAIEHLLHLTREDLEAAHRDHILDAVDHPQLAVGIDRPDIPRPQVVPREHLGIGGRVVPVAAHDLWARYCALARLPWRRVTARILAVEQLHARIRDRLADRPCLARLGIRISGDDAAAL